MQRRLKVAVALKGISMREYCQAAIGRELAKDEADGVSILPFGDEAVDRFESVRAEIFGGRKLPGDAVDLIHEARASRV